MLKDELVAQEVIRERERDVTNNRGGKTENRGKSPEESSKQRPVEGGKRELAAREG